MAERATFEGTVTWASDTGIKLDGFAGGTEYLNKSGQGEGATLVMPAKGSRVRVTATQSAKGKWYLDRIEPMAGGTAPTSAGPGYAAAPPASPDRELHIIRQNALSHAVVILVHNEGILAANLPPPEQQEGQPLPQPNGLVRAEQVMKLADLLVQWVLRPAPDGTDS